MYGALKSYRLPFLLAGCPLIICALIMLLIHRVKDQDVDCIESEGNSNNEIKRKSSESPDVNGNQNIHQATSYSVHPISPNNLKGLLSLLNLLWLTNDDLNLVYLFLCIFLYQGERVSVNKSSDVVLGATKVMVSNRKPVIATMNNWSPAVGRYHVPPMAYGTTNQGTYPVFLTSFQPNTSAILWWIIAEQNVYGGWNRNRTENLFRLISKWHNNMHWERNMVGWSVLPLPFSIYWNELMIVYTST
jgi:hypothetical protein